MTLGDGRTAAEATADVAGAPESVGVLLPGGTHAAAAKTKSQGEGFTRPFYTPLAPQVYVRFPLGPEGGTGSARS